MEKAEIVAVERNVLAVVVEIAGAEQVERLVGDIDQSLAADTEAVELPFPDAAAMIFRTISIASTSTSTFAHLYNHQRPHGGLGGRTPSE